MSTITIDIETIPTENEVIQKYILDSLSAPKNIKDPEKITANLAAQAEDAVHKTGLSGLFGNVLCVGLAENDGPVTTLYNTTGEGNLLADVRALICPTLTHGADNPWCTNTLVGHNINGFDVPFLSQRMMVRGMHPLFKHGTKPWDMQVNDTMLMFAAGTKNYYKLEQLCLAFGVNSPKDGGVDGSQIYEYYQAGKHDEIRAYCARDVEATRAVYNRMMVQ